MHAIVSKSEGLPDQVEVPERIAADALALSLSEMEGFYGILADRERGKVEKVTLYGNPLW